MQSFFDRLSQCLTTEPAFCKFNAHGKSALFFLYPDLVHFNKHLVNGHDSTYLLSVLLDALVPYISLMLCVLPSLVISKPAAGLYFFRSPLCHTTFLLPAS